jgi:hypothetical protein
MYIEREIRSTFYILKCIADSILTTQPDSIKVVFGVSEVEKLTGLWKNDSRYISILRYGNIQRQSLKKSGRLIVGLGPSGSGKTYWINSILELFMTADSSFPQSFISIDGGTYRMTSEIYKIIRDLAQENCLGGFINLVRSSKVNPFKNSLFEAGLIKKIIKNFLKRESDDIQISLYVPDTLGSCLANCIKEIQPFIDITRDKKWIGVLVWQHKLSSDCNFTEKYSCVGCTESGKRRERTEGKKYSNRSWNISMNSGYNLVLKAPGGTFMVHNSGSSKSSVLYTSPKNDPFINETLKQYATRFNYVYIEENFQKSIRK